MGFDVENFGIGLITGWATAYGIYRFRRVIGSAVTATREGATNVRSTATRSADSRYINDLTEFAERSHLAGKFIKLNDILIEPRFLPAPPLAAPPEDEVLQDVFYVIPRVHDYPYLHAAYNLETLSMDDLATGSRALALLGLPGSGRTTALLSIALRSLGKVRFEKPTDKLQAKLDAEEAKLTEKERAARLKERRTIEERAKERLKEQHGVTFEQMSEEKLAAALNQFMPVYVHLANVSVSAEEYGNEIDPAEPLVRAVQSQAGRVVASTIPRNLYKRLNAGQALVLLDGYDELPEAEQVEKAAWLKGFMREYGSNGNVIIITGQPQGYGIFTQLGFTPLYLRPWSDGDTERAVERWSQAWPQIGKAGRGAAPLPEAGLVERARINNRALSPTELTLKIWGTFAGDTESAGFEGWLRAFVARYLPKNQAIGMILPQLAQMAAVQLDEGFITVARLEALARSGSSADMNAMLDQMLASEAPEEVEEAKPSSSKAKDKKAEEEASAQSKLVTLLRRNGLLVAYRNGRYQFRHAHIAAYLASLTLKDAPDALAIKAENPAWSQAIAYASLHMPVDSLVQKRMSTTPDLLHNNELELTRWLAYTSGSKVNWGAMLLKHVANMFIAPNQYVLLRERAAAALIGSRDKNATAVFKQALRHPNTDVRRLACLGLGAIGDAEAVKDLASMLTNQPVDVQIAAGMALGAIKTDAALDEIVIALTEGSEQVRHAVAEAMAALPDEGHPTLYDAISHEDMMVRRAAAFGLRRIQAPWATASLYRAFLDDDQWYVRSAAQQAFQDIQGDQNRGPERYPVVSEIAWLVNWAAARGEGVPQGEAGAQMLLEAMREGDNAVRALAARNLGQLGEVTAAKALYGALRDRQEVVRTAAHLALADLEAQVGEPLPAPV